MNITKDIIDFFYFNRKKIIITGLFIIIVIPIVIYFYKNNNVEKEPSIIEKEKIEDNKEEVQVISNFVLIDVKGEVNNPGCYEIEGDKRVKDAIELAGGLTSKASTEDLNLSAKLYDEMVIVVNKKEEANKIESDTSIKVTTKIETKKDVISGKISINKASIKELTSLPGIGEAKAKSIVDYRNKNGPFKSIEEIKKVKGIGDSIFEKIKNNITL